MLHGYDIKITDDDLNDSDKEDKDEFGNWLEDAFAFITDVFIGVEKEVYKQTEKNEKIKEKFKETEGMLVGMKFIEYYLNQVYRQLVEKLDPFIVETFVKLGEKTDEKPLFILNIIDNIINKKHLKYHERRSVQPLNSISLDNKNSFIKFNNNSNKGSYNKKISKSIFSESSCDNSNINLIHSNLVNNINNINNSNINNITNNNKNSLENFASIINNINSKYKLLYIKIN